MFFFNHIVGYTNYKQLFLKVLAVIDWKKLSLHSFDRNMTYYRRVRVRAGELKLELNPGYFIISVKHELGAHIDFGLLEVLRYFITDFGHEFLFSSTRIVIFKFLVHTFSLLALAKRH